MPGTANDMTYRRANLAMAFQELFTATVRLRFNRQNVSSEDAFRTQIREGLGRAMNEGNARGYSPEDVRVAAYAVVAFLDETILQSKNPVFAKWSGQPLQHELSHKHLAGEEFFDCVQHLLGRRDAAEAADVLEVFYLCLLLGYRGRYGASGAGELNGIFQAMREKITRCRGTNALLSPQAMLPLDPPQPKAVDPWFRRLSLACVAAALIGIIVFVGCKVLLIGGASGLGTLANR